MSTVFTSAVADALKETLEEIVTDKNDGLESKLVMSKWCKEMGMSDNYEDDLEVGGPGLAMETPEGATVSTGTIKEGVLTRYIARKFGLRLMVTEEAMEDCKYDQVIDAARRLKRALYKTVDIDSTNILARAFNTSFVIGDGLSLCNSAHTLPQGGTFSNTMATPMSPSRQAVIVATSQIKKFPGHDGITEGYNPEKIVCPTEQWAVWSALVKSEKAPEPGNFNEINVVNSDLNLTIVPNQYWSNTTTNWVVLTDSDSKINFRWRRRPKSRSYVENNNEVMIYHISARWARGCSDPRAILGVNA